MRRRAISGSQPTPDGEVGPVFPLHAERRRRREARGVLYRHVITKVTSVRRKREALDEVLARPGGNGDRNPDEIRRERSRVDDERLTFPAADRMAEQRRRDVR